MFVSNCNLIKSYCSLTYLDPKFRASSVASIKSVTYDTKLFTLRLRPGSFLQVPTGHHVTLRADVSGEEIERDYTPVCTLADTAKRQPQAQHQAASSDTIQMMIKLYKDGKMSGYLDKLKVGKLKAANNDITSFNV